MRKSNFSQQLAQLFTLFSALPQLILAHDAPDLNWPRRLEMPGRPLSDWTSEQIRQRCNLFAPADEECYYNSDCRQVMSNYINAEGLVSGITACQVPLADPQEFDLSDSENSNVKRLLEYAHEQYKAGMPLRQLFEEIMGFFGGDYADDPELKQFQDELIKRIAKDLGVPVPKSVQRFAHPVSLFFTNDAGSAQTSKHYLAAYRPAS